MDRSSALATIAAFGVALGVACGGPDVFGCTQDEQCINNDVLGVCQPTGFCSFPDESCEGTQQRYGDRAGRGLAGMCVPIGEDSNDGPPADAADVPGDDDGDDDAVPTSTSSMADDAPDDDASGPTGGMTAWPPPTTTDPTDGEESTTEIPEPVWLCFGERADSDVQNVTRDTFLAENTATLNFGGHVDLHVHDSAGGSRAIIAFDLSEIESGAQIVDATLEVWTDVEGLLDTGYLGVFRLLESWTEGDADFGDGVANWNERNAGVQWQTAGAGPGSYDITELGQLAPDAPRSAFTVDLPATIVQAWVDDPSQNHGIVLRGIDSTSYAWIWSSEYGEASRRPELCVGYVPP